MLFEVTLNDVMEAQSISFSTDSLTVDTIEIDSYTTDAEILQQLADIGYVDDVSKFWVIRHCDDFDFIEVACEELGPAISLNHYEEVRSCSI